MGALSLLDGHLRAFAHPAFRDTLSEDLAPDVEVKTKVTHGAVAVPLAFAATELADRAVVHTSGPGLYEITSTLVVVHTGLAEVYPVGAADVLAVRTGIGNKGAGPAHHGALLNACNCAHLTSETAHAVPAWAVGVL